MKFEGKFINEKGKQVNWWFEAPDESVLREHLQQKRWKIVSMKGQMVSPANESKSSNPQLSSTSPPKLFKPFCRLNEKEKRAVGSLYTFSGVTFALFSWSFNPVWLALSILGCVAGTLSRVDPEALTSRPKQRTGETVDPQEVEEYEEACLRQNYSPPITEQEIKNFSNAFEKNVGTTNKNPLNAWRGGKLMKKPILTLFGLNAVLGTIVYVAPISAPVAVPIMLLANGLAIAGYKLGKKGKK